MSTRHQTKPAFRLRQKWRMRGGQIATIDLIDTSEIPIRTVIEGVHRWHLPDGKHATDCRNENQYDLVKLITEGESAVDRLIAIAQKCLPHVDPTALAVEQAKTKPIAECYLNTLLRRTINAAKRERAAARRANGGAP